jgi:hypothetical protein
MDIERALRRSNIEYITTGPNVGKDHLNIHCPLCGDADPSYHMGIHRKTGRWGCWRSSLHRGKTLASLLAAVLHCSYEQARALVDEDGASPDSMQEAVRALLGQEEPSPILQVLQLDPSFRRIKSTGSTVRFFRYLQNRGFDHTEDFITSYGLQCALTGTWGCRVVVPFLREGELVGWTARAIGPAEIRYKTHPPGPAIKQTLLGLDGLRHGGERLFVVEGPFDALKLDWCFWQGNSGNRAVPLLGTSATAAQVALLAELADMYREVVLLLDADAQAQALTLAGAVSFLRPRIGTLPPDRKDPGEMSRQEILGL